MRKWIDFGGLAGIWINATIDTIYNDSLKHCKYSTCACTMYLMQASVLLPLIFIEHEPHIPIK